MLFRSVSIKCIDDCMFFAKVFVGPYCYVLVVWVACIIIFSLGECVCSIGGAWFIFEEEVILLSFQEVSCDALSNFPCVAVVAEVSMICEHQDEDFCSFEQVRPCAQSSHDGKKFAVIDRVVLLRITEFLGCETKRASWSWFLLSIWQCDGFVALV